MSWNNHHTFPYNYLNINVLEIESIINIKFVGMSSAGKNFRLNVKRMFDKHINDKIRILIS